MRDAHPLERAVGMAYYVSDADGVGGRIRDRPEDFRVRELEGIDPAPLDADPGSYPHLVVRATLRSWDTNAFARALSNALGISRERISWAGTKDKRAVTTQLVSIDGVDPAALPSIDGIELEAIGRFGRPVLFGDLAGNDFEITVRDPTAPQQLDPITTALREFGGGPVAVPNFFGQQRFGSRRPVTHEVGLRLLERDWEGAVMAYVGAPSELESADARSARAFVEETRDWAAAVDRMPDRLGHERAILHRLAGPDSGASPYRDALEALPENLRQLFVHAAQSYVFNRILSARLEADLPFDRAVPGDVVCFAERHGDLTIPDPDRTQAVTADRVSTVNRHLERGRAFVTAPLVGTDTVLAEAEPGAIECRVLDEVGIEPSDFDLPGEYASSGTRRAILLRTDLTIDRDPIRFGFELPKGSYATVLLREFLKSPPGDLA